MSQIADDVVHFSTTTCAFGTLLVAHGNRGVCAIYLGDDPEVLTNDLLADFPNDILLKSEDHTDQIVVAAATFVERPSLEFALPLDIRGTAFQRRVWDALMKIPAGKTASYADVAEMIGEPKAVRAASACGANKIAIAIPCHRVIRKDGSASGYRRGVQRKGSILDRERMLQSALMHHR